MSELNPLNLHGIEFVEFAGGESGFMEKVFADFGFSCLKKHQDKDVTYWRQNDIHFLLNRHATGFSADFTKAHGPCISAMGFRVDDARAAFMTAVERGAKPYTGSKDSKTMDLPAIYGIGDSLVYFVEAWGEDVDPYAREFADLEEPQIVADKGFICIDHLTNNVHQGTRDQWADFYKNIFGFTEVRYFDIKGKKTGLTSYALQSPCKTFCLPINVGTDEKSQIEEYLREYNGPGIQHLAFLTGDLLKSLDSLEGSSIDTLDIAPEYYEAVFNRVPNVKEDHGHIQKHDVLVDGDEDGYLLQIFTKNLFGPIFIEMIQRNNHYSFGEGNFQALFDSIERDQEKRGVL